MSAGTPLRSPVAPQTFGTRFLLAGSQMDSGKRTVCRFLNRHSIFLCNRIWWPVRGTCQMVSMAIQTVTASWTGSSISIMTIFHSGQVRTLTLTGGAWRQSLTLGPVLI